MVTQIISKYLKSHRRLNIPGVGAFMSKGDGGEILFSELLKKDDGVLRTLLSEAGMREIEVAAAIDRFVFELRHATEGVGGEFVMEGFGALRREDNGKLTFVVVVEQLPEVELIIEEPELSESQESQEPEESIQELVQEPLPELELVQEQPQVPIKELVQDKLQDKSQDKLQQQPQDKPQEQPQDLSQSISQEGEIRYTPEKIKELYYKPQSFREKDPDVEDLTYSRRRKPLNGYTYAQSDRKKKGVDKVLLFGIVAAVIAVAVIAYGYYVNNYM